MSFRARLLVFFTIIVVIPMIAVALVLFSLTKDSETGKADAQIDERHPGHAPAQLELEQPRVERKRLLDVSNLEGDVVDPDQPGWSSHRCTSTMMPARGYSSAGRAPGSHPGGRGFESP